MITIDLNSRLHFSLVSMHYSSYRINGGIGVAINNPSLRLLIKTSSSCNINTTSNTLNKAILLVPELLNNVCKKYQFKEKVNIIITGNQIVHSGFGSGTSIRLACIEALFIVNDEKYTHKLLVTLSGRGGTSGIGINSYFEGGFVFDLGHSNNQDQSLRPSHQGSRQSPPLLLGQYAMPNWNIGICIPKSLKPLTHKQEQSFFKDTCPLADQEVFETSYHALFGILGSILAKDYLKYCEAINTIQGCAWKQAERHIHGNELVKADQMLKRLGADAVGMSSLGPSLYFYSKDVDSIIHQVDTRHYDIFKTSHVNSGRLISYA